MARKKQEAAAAVEQGPSVQQQGTQVETNAGVRKDVMLNGFNGMHQLEAQLNKLSEKHIEPIKKAIAKDRKNLCADLNMKWADLKPLFDLEKRAIAARTMEDMDAGKDILDNIKEAHTYLKTGENLDFLEVLHDTEAEEEKTPAYIGDEFEDKESGPEKIQGAQDGNGADSKATT